MRIEREGQMVKSGKLLRAPRLIAFAAVVAALIFSASGAAAATQYGKIEHTIDKKTNAVTAVIKFENDFQYKTFSLSDPARFVIDIEGVVLPNGGVKGGETHEVGDKSVKSIRVAQFSRNPDIVRIVMDTTDGVEFDVEKNEKYHKLVIRTSGEAAAEKLPALAAPSISRNGGSTILSFKAAGKESDFNAIKIFNADGSITLKIAFPGFVADSQHATTQVSSGVVDSVTLKQDGKTAYALIRANVPTGYKVEYRKDDGVVAVTVRQPSVAGNMICVDAGHGGKDPGAIGPDGSQEKNLALDVALRLRRLLRSAGAKVVMTRADDTFIPLLDRSTISNNAGCKVFLSIHLNALPNHGSRQEIRGSQTYYYAETSKPYAVTMLTEMEAIMGIGEGGAHYKNLSVTRNSAIDAVLAEIGYISHRRDLALLLTPEFRENTARGLYNGLEEYFGMAGDRMPAVAVPDSVASNLLHRPRVPTHEIYVASNPEICGDAPGTTLEADDENLFARPSAGISIPGAPVVEKPAPSPSRSRRARSVQKFPREPWNVISYTRMLSMNK